MKQRLLCSMVLVLYVLGVQATIADVDGMRETIRLDKGWKFAMGHATDTKKDFGCGTEYFNYLTKANSIHNEGPYSQKFDDSGWQDVLIPHDWVSTLPYANEASHSHGYKTVGYKYPETSVGWYRKTFKIDHEDLGKRMMLRFDGIFRNAQVWFNGFYMGTEPSGYTTQVFDITPYIKYGDDNLVCVRADASLEEGWFYEGAGIYRDVWLEKSAEVSVAPFGTFVYAELNKPYSKAKLYIETEVCNSALKSQQCEVVQRLLDADGKEIGNGEPYQRGALQKDDHRHEECQHRHGLHAPTHPSKQVTARAVEVFIDSLFQPFIGNILMFENIALHHHVEHATRIFRPAQQRRLLA